MSEIEKLADWIEYLEDRGVDPELIELYSEYGYGLASNDLPIVTEIEHFSKLAGIKLSKVAAMVACPSRFYREFRIKKRRGGTRIISSPYPSLLCCQKWIYENILLQGSVHHAAHGFVRGRSIITNAKVHIGQKEILKVDLKDYFPTVPFSWVIKHFFKLGYNRKISYIFAALCCKDGCLAQGAATSPALANILSFRLDVRLSAFAKKCSLKYTRYADDLCFSGDHINLGISRTVGEIITDCGFIVNREKTQLLRGNGKRIITGVSVAGGRLRLPRESVRNLRREFHYVRKFGLLSHVNNQRVKNPFYLQSLIGRFAFWLQIEPENSFAKSGFDYLCRMATEREW